MTITQSLYLGKFTLHNNTEYLFENGDMSMPNSDPRTKNIFLRMQPMHPGQSLISGVRVSECQIFEAHATLGDTDYVVAFSVHTHVSFEIKLTISMDDKGNVRFDPCIIKKGEKDCEEHLDLLNSPDPTQRSRGYTA